MPSVVRLESRFPEIIAELDTVRAEELTLAVAERVAEKAAEGAPVGDSEPHLKDTIEARPYSTGVGAGIVRVAAVTAKFYWFFNEFGTVNQDAKPFMVPAAEEVRITEVPTIGAAVLSKL